ncbi:MAG TPA: PAS domain S-box protein, partial [Syntrophorhabdaceae bacterium]|nr:PAS domain S-box protein [Syntrophorhabdaceae bacterium]
MGRTSGSRSTLLRARARGTIPKRGQDGEHVAVLEALNIPVTLIAPHYTYHWANSCYAKAHGKTQGEIVGRTVQEVWGEKFNDVIKGNLDRCFKGAEVRDEGWVSFKALGRRYCEVVYSPYRSVGGSVIAAMVITYDVTDREELERRLSQSEERFRDLSEASLEAIVFMEQGVIINANSALSRMFGYELEEALGKPTTNFIAPEYRADIEEKVRTKSEGVYESMGVRKDGICFPIEINARELHLRGRRLRVAAVRDLTERKRIEAELKAHRDHLEKLVEERTRELARSEEKFRSIVEHATEG